MDCSGHEKMGQIGETILKDALLKGLGTDMRVNAFALGNWLTDVSQFVDARTYKKVRKEMLSLLNKIKPVILDAMDALIRIQERVKLDDPLIDSEILEALPQSVSDWVDSIDIDFDLKAKKK